MENTDPMTSQPERIVEYAEARAEAAPIEAEELLHFVAHRVELGHAPSRQLAAPKRNADAVILAVAWLGPNRVEESLDAVLPILSVEELGEFVAAPTTMHVWMPEPLGRRLAYC